MPYRHVLLLVLIAGSAATAETGSGSLPFGAAPDLQGTLHFTALEPGDTASGFAPFAGYTQPASSDYTYLYRVENGSSSGGALTFGDAHAWIGVEILTPSDPGKTSAIHSVGSDAGGGEAPSAFRHAQTPRKRVDYEFDTDPSFGIVPAGGTSAVLRFRSPFGPTSDGGLIVTRNTDPPGHFAELGSGVTTPLPEPGALGLVFGAMAVAALARRRLRAAARAGLPFALLLLPVLAAPGARAAVCQEDSWVAGSVDLCAGELVYRDYVYDDFGAQSATTPPPPLDYSNLPEGDAYGLLPPSGAERYASGQDNTADLVALRIAVGGGQVDVRFELNTLFPGSSTIAAIAIDADDDPGTGSCTWPGLSVQPVGAEICQSSDTTGATVSVDPAANTIAWSFPQPGGTTWRLQAVTARGNGTVMNAAFRGYGDRGFWFENEQAVALKNGDISAFAHTVSVADLTGGTTAPATAPKGHVLQRVYTSQHTVPPHEGIDHDGVPGAGFTTANGGAFYSQAYNFLGRYQPYGFYQPDQPGPHGVQLMMHGLGENHSARLFFPGTPRGADGGGINLDIGEARNRILVSPLGRGWKNWWSEYGERDVLDALDDVLARYPVDVEQVHVSGYSMGGYGTYRLGALNADRFASFIAWVAAAGDYLTGVPFFGPFSSTGNEGNALEFLTNLRHVPGAMLYMAEDELVPAATAIEVRDRFAELGYEHIHWFHHDGEHLTLVAIDEWTKESAYSAGRTRVVSPARVSFRTLPSTWHPDLGLVHDRAYWLSGITPSDPNDFAEVDLHSLGCGLDARVNETLLPGAGVGPGSLTWDSREIAGSLGATVPVSNCLQGEISNVMALDVDAGAACLTPDPLSYRITSDGPATIHLSDGRDIVLPGAGTHEDGPPVGQVVPSVALLRTGRGAQFEVPCAGVAIDWSVQEGAAGGTIDASGRYTAPNTLPGNRLAHVEAREAGGGALLGVATVHLRQNAGGSS